jgi:hypothetical protein
VGRVADVLSPRQRVAYYFDVAARPTSEDA